MSDIINYIYQKQSIMSLFSRFPGDTYYEGMPWKYRGQRIAAWQRDLNAVRRAKYPRGK